jgi:hypothetical protein
MIKTFKYLTKRSENVVSLGDSMKNMNNVVGKMQRRSYFLVGCIFKV